MRRRFHADALEAPFADAQIALGAMRLAVPGVPKRSLLTYYFRRAAIDGMTDPYFLEIIVNPDVLDFERPFVIAHEWAHLAGYANEAEANFLAWLTCVRGNSALQYSGWLSAYRARARGGAARRSRDASSRSTMVRGRICRRWLPATRNRRRWCVAPRNGVYDEYLKANRISEGIASYDAVVRLMIGTRFNDAMDAPSALTERVLLSTDRGDGRSSWSKSDGETGAGARPVRRSSGCTSGPSSLMSTSRHLRQPH